MYGFEGEVRAKYPLSLSLIFFFFYSLSFIEFSNRPTQPCSVSLSRFSLTLDGYNDLAMQCFSELFCYLPLAHVINNKIYVVHGGLFSQDGITLDRIRNLPRVCEPPETGLIADVLWADPQKGIFLTYSVFSVNATCFFCFVSPLIY